MRDLEINKEEERDVDPSKRFHKLKEPYLAILTGEWDAVKSFFDKYPKLVFSPLTEDEDTAFHIAAYSGENEVLQHLVCLVPSSRIFKVLSRKNVRGNNTFHEVATTDEVESAEFLITKLLAADGQDKVRGSNLVQLKELLEDRNQEGETPLFMAAALGHTKMAKFLAKKVGNISQHFQRNDGESILHIAIKGQSFDTGIWLLGKDKQLASRMGKDGLTCLQLLSKMPAAFRSSYSFSSKLKKFLYNYLPSQIEDEDEDDDGDHEDLESGQSSNSFPKSKKHSSGTISRIFRAMRRRLAKGWPNIYELWRMKITNISASTLTDLLVEVDTTFHNSKRGKADSLDENYGVQGKQGKEKLSSTIERRQGGGDTTEGQSSEGYETPSALFIAASNGIVEIFEKILKVYPQASDHITKDEQNILHVAISHRKLKIFHRISEMKPMMKIRLASRIDKNGYTILHQVADMTNHDGRNIFGPAVQLRNELIWQQRVQKISPSHYVMHKNKDGKTADELFKEQHADLLVKAQTWIKETCQSCSSFALGIVAVAFASTFAISGGNDKSSHENANPYFLFFTIMNVFTLTSSLSSAALFLTNLSSSMGYEDFLNSLLHNLVIGLVLLFLSVTTTTLSFAASLFLILPSAKKTWISILSYTAAFLPLSIFFIIQFKMTIADLFIHYSGVLIRKIVKTLHQKPAPHFLKDQ